MGLRRSSLRRSPGLPLEFTTISSETHEYGSLIAGSQLNALAPGPVSEEIPINEGTLTTAAVTAAVVLGAAALVGAILGGLAGMRFHRRVDHADLTPSR